MEPRYTLRKFNQDTGQGSRLNELYIKEMFLYLENKVTFHEDDFDQSKIYLQKVNNWIEKREKELSKEKQDWITRNP